MNYLRSHTPKNMKTTKITHCYVNFFIASAMFYLISQQYEMSEEAIIISGWRQQAEDN